MNYVIEARYAAQSSTGLITQKGKVLEWNTEQEARDFGKAEIEKSRFVASWEAITVREAKARGHNIE